MTRELPVAAVIGATLLSLSLGAPPSFEGVARAAGPAAPAPPSADPPVPAPCAAEPNALCPMQPWMNANAAAPLAARDFESLVASFGRLVAAAPPGFVNWASIARDGADAARVEDLEAVQAACRGCHAQYAARYHASGDRPH